MGNTGVYSCHLHEHIPSQLIQREYQRLLLVIKSKKVTNCSKVFERPRAMSL